jgi:hypothetical protein
MCRRKRASPIGQALSPVADGQSTELYIIADTHSFEEKVIRWYGDLLLRRDRVDDQMGFDNGIMMAHGMCPPLHLTGIL